MCIAPPYHEPLCFVFLNSLSIASNLMPITSPVFDNVFLENHRQQSTAILGFLLSNENSKFKIRFHFQVLTKLLPDIRRDLRLVRCGCQEIHEREILIYGTPRSMGGGSGLVPARRPVDVRESSRDLVEAEPQTAPQIPYYIKYLVNRYWLEYKWRNL